MNTTGKLFTFTSFGESHGKGIGGIIDGCPAGIELDETFIQNELSRRRPGQSIISTPRSEEDNVEFLSGIFEGKTTGTPIAFVIWNKNQESKDYDHLKDVYRPSHADFTYQQNTVYATIAVADGVQHALRLRGWQQEPLPNWY